MNCHPLPLPPQPQLQPQPQPQPPLRMRRHHHGPEQSEQEDRAGMNLTFGVWFICGDFDWGNSKANLLQMRDTA
jgi:hypothetical protein